MTEKMIGTDAHGFVWLDITDPDPDELKNIADQYQLHPALVKDCLQPDHLPKYERMDQYAFVIFRVAVEDSSPETDSVQGLTDKIALFYSEEFMLTIHRKEQPLLVPMAELSANGHSGNTAELLNTLIYACLNTYETPLSKLSKEVDYYEQTVFLRPRKAPLLKGLYYLKRKIDLLKKMLILSFDIIDSVDSEAGNVNTRDTRDEYLKLQHMFEALSENIHQLLGIYFSASSQKTNETIRILTIFSVFFMPLTFIVGVYGMNFEFMPELKWKAGYPVALTAMSLVTLLIYIWFKRKKWL